MKQLSAAFHVEHDFLEIQGERDSGEAGTLIGYPEREKLGASIDERMAVVVSGNWFHE